MSKIRILSDALANKIAAGEVVERPASVVKELLENSLDAGAAQIEVEVIAGGKRLIRVEDDGEGMTPDDALLAFERHATSKLHRADDLMEIATLGFRGEALPSIASVSHVLLETRHESSTIGTAVEIHGAKMTGVKEIARSRGTTLTIRDLFYNIPARKKFLKSESTELSHIVNAATHYALAHPEISFLLKSAGSELFRFQAVPETRDRVFQVFGGELLKNLIPLEARLPIFLQDEEENGETRTEQGWLRVQGFISNPSIQKLNRNSMSFFVNRRLVRDRILLHAISEGYRNILPGDMFPVVLIFLEMPFREVDVNVHPSKTEVRFRRQALVHDFLRDTVRKGLLEARTQAPFPVRQGRAVSSGSTSPFDMPEETLNFDSAKLPSEPIGSRIKQEAASTAISQSDRAIPPLTLHPPSPPPAPGRLPFSAEEPLYITSQEVEAISAETSFPSRPVDPGLPPAAGAVLDDAGDIVPLGQIDNSFIVAVDRGALLIIDQHVAHERILFEKVLEQRSRGKVESQRMLLPIIVELSPRQQVILENIMPELASCGFEVEPFGKKTVAIKSAPADLAAGDAQQLLEELLEGLEKESQAVSLVKLREKIAASISCHAAIKVNTRLDQQKMRWLIEQLMKTQYPTTCPHGRPIVLRYEKNALLRAFKRL